MNTKRNSKFLNEHNLIGNPGIPGEPNKREGEDKYLRSVERRATKRLGVGIDNSSQNSNLLSQLMGLLGKLREYTIGYEKKLEKLAESVIISYYGYLINKYDVTLDIKIAKSGSEIGSFLKESLDNDIRDERYKRKISNLIIQGEAKNTKHILHSDEVKDGFRKIYGSDWEIPFNLCDELSKTADKLDWTFDIQTKGDLMMNTSSSGFAGAVRVEWLAKESDETENDNINNFDNDIDDEDDYTNNDTFYDNDENNDEDMSMYDQEMNQEVNQEMEYTPIIKARGVDFTMLLHESVKGIYEMLSKNGIPKNTHIAKEVIGSLQSSLYDEAEDFRYGPEIAADLRDFINENKNIDKYPNIREIVYKIMIDVNTMPTKEFLELMRGILSKTSKARIAIDRLVTDAIQNIETHLEYEQYKQDMIRYKQDMIQYENDLKEWENQQKNRKQNQTNVEHEEPIEIDYSNMSPRELQKNMDNALDSGDYTLANKISQYMKTESKKYSYRKTRNN